MCHVQKLEIAQAGFICRESWLSDFISFCNVHRFEAACYRDNPLLHEIDIQFALTVYICISFHFITMVPPYMF